MTSLNVLRVTNLTRQVTAAHLREVFGHFGDVARAWTWPSTRRWGWSRGYAVGRSERRARRAVAAKAALDGAVRRGTATPCASRASRRRVGIVEAARCARRRPRRGRGALSRSRSASSRSRSSRSRPPAARWTPMQSRVDEPYSPLALKRAVAVAASVAAAARRAARRRRSPGAAPPAAGGAAGRGAAAAVAATRRRWPLARAWAAPDHMTWYLPWRTCTYPKAQRAACAHPLARRGLSLISLNGFSRKPVGLLSGNYRSRRTTKRLMPT